MGRTGRVGPSLGTMARHNLWPTPLASDADKEPTGSLSRLVRTGHPAGRLDGTVRETWPTPTARDWRSGKASATTLERNSRPLSEVVYATATTKANQGSPSMQKWPGCAAAPAGGYLNPTWVEWLQGLPIGWTELEP